MRDGLYRVHYQYTDAKQARLAGRKMHIWYQETFQHFESAKNFLDTLLETNCYTAELEIVTISKLEIVTMKNVLRWSIHSRDACMALERLIYWLHPIGFYKNPLYRHLKYGEYSS